MPPYTTNSSYISSYPNVYTTTATSTVSSPTIYLSYESTEEKIKEYTEKTDKHVDELEADIEFLNKERQDMNDKLIFQATTIYDLTNRIKELEDTCKSLKTFVNYLETRMEEINGN